MVNADHTHSWVLQGVGSGTAEIDVSWGDHATCWCGVIIDRQKLVQPSPVTLYKWHHGLDEWWDTLDWNTKEAVRRLLEARARDLSHKETPWHETAAGRMPA